MRRLWEQLAIATNWPVLVAVAVLSSVGVMCIWADAQASGAEAQQDGVKQLIFLAVSFACMTLFQAVNYLTIGRFAWPFYVLSLLLILYTVVAQKLGGLPFVHRTKGAWAWINFGPASLEPAELMKIAFVLLLARYLRFRSNYRTLAGLLPPFAMALVPAALILMQPDLGMAALFMPTLFAMLFVAGARIKHLALIVLMGVAMMPLLWFSGPTPGPNLPVLRLFPAIVKTYQRQRVYAMFKHDPKTMRESAYQTQRATTAFASGGVTGKGAAAIPIGRTVPEAHNDMIFALVGEQFGFVGAAVVLGAFLVLFAAGIEIAAATKEPFGRLIAVGIIAVLASQTLVNLMVMLRLIPVTGITLPFVSYGGSSLVSSFMAVGLLLNVGQNRPLVMAREAFEFE